MKLDLPGRFVGVWLLSGVCLAVSFCQSSQAVALGATLKYASAQEKDHDALSDEEQQDCKFNLAFNPDGKTLAIGGGRGHLELWDVKSGKKLSGIEGARDTIRLVAFRADGKILASGCDGEVKLWAIPQH